VLSEKAALQIRYQSLVGESSEFHFLQKTPNRFGAQKFRHQPLAEASNMGSFEHTH